MSDLLKFNTHAEMFEEAIPIGNGKIGAMIYGGTKKEHISLNEDTLWSGYADKNFVPQDAPDAYHRAQEAMLNNDPHLAENILEEDFQSERTASFLPLGAIDVSFNHDDTENYSRTLNMKNGVTEITYECDGTKYSREYFVSKKYNCLSAKFKSENYKKLSFDISFESVLNIENIEISNGMYIVDGVCPSKIEFPPKGAESYIYYNEPNRRGVSFSLVIKIVPVNGKVFGNGEKISVVASDEVNMYVFVKTNFVDWNVTLPSDCSYREECLCEASKSHNYDEIKEEHIKDFEGLYCRTCLELCDKDNSFSDLQLPDRIKDFDGTDIELYEHLFNFGKYLAISSSRNCTQATTLQGIWNEQPTPPWNSNYTVNINTEMNYWPILPLDLSECYNPFLKLAKNISESGEITAKDYYNAKGFVCHHNVDIWAHTNPVSYKTKRSSRWANWNMGSGWIACQIFDYYEYTLDKKILSEEIYPIMKKAAEFYLDIMILYQGEFIVCPSSSPENSYYHKGSPVSLAITATMTVSIIKELFLRLLKCFDILGIDDEFSTQINAVYAKLPIPKVADDKRLLEWYNDEEEAEPEHRHISHLYSLFPGNFISLRKTPELADACRSSLLARGDGGTGWSLAWKTNIWAYLYDGNHALKMIDRQLEYVDPRVKRDVVKDGGGSYPNLFCAHPPFQIDGNFGITAAVINMLVQSYEDEIILLPALPDRWKNGSFKGIKVKNNIILDIEWKEKMVVKSKLTPLNDCDISIIVNGKCLKLSLIKGKAIELF